jgi:hypothetical protein
MILLRKIEAKSSTYSSKDCVQMMLDWCHKLCCLDISLEGLRETNRNILLSIFGFQTPILEQGIPKYKSEALRGSLVG